MAWKKENKRMIDITGKRYGHVVVISRHGRKYGRIAWLCKCDCDNELIATTDELRRGYVVSCGCQRAKTMHDISYKHGMTGTRLFKIWSCMKQRCLNPNYNQFYLYGGRGITICSEWENDFPAFAEWAKNNGYNDTLTIDRIDCNKGYCPDNCRWVTYKSQANNKRNNRKLTYKNETHTISEWAEIKGISYSCLKSRIKLGWDVEDALEKPVRWNCRWHKKSC